MLSFVYSVHGALSTRRMWGNVGVALVSLFVWSAYTPLAHADDLFGGGGEGRDGSSVENAWLIESCEQLQNIGNSTDTLTMYFEIPDSVDEIDCTATNPQDADHGASPWGEGGFDPIGTSTDSFEFTGDFNGNNKTIRGLYVGGESVDEGVGLFSVVGVGGQIYDVILEDTTVSGTQSSVGGLVGYNKGILSNVHVQEGIVSGNDDVAWVGGLVGLNEGDIASSSANIILAGRDDTGGFVGRHDAGTISASFSLGPVYGRGESINSIGGFVGIMGGTGDIIDSYSQSAVLVSSGGSGIGGFVGETDGSGTLTNVYAAGIVGGGDGGAGGFVGSIGSVTVISSYWDTETSTQVSSDAGVGTSTTHMKDEATFDGWDFVTLWAIDSVGIGTGGAFINNGYPYLIGIENQDEDDVALPIVSMELEDATYTSLSSTSVSIKGTIISSGSEDVTSRGFYWGADTFYGSTTEEVGGGPYGTGDYAMTITVACDSTYYFKPFASSSAGLALGPDIVISNLDCPSYEEVTGSSDGNSVWGTDIYTSDSDKGAIAVHMGLIEDGQQAFVLVEFLPGEDSYTGSTRNGVTTQDYDEWPQSIRLSLAQPTPRSISVDVATTAATITWTTDYNASQKVSFGPTASYGTSTEEGAVNAVSHEVALEGLVGCTLYHYRAISRDAYIGAATSTDATFTTTGCTSSASVSTSTASTITTAGGGTLTFATTTVTIPASFTGTSSSATFQAHELNATTFFAEVAEPTGIDRIGNYVVTLRALTDATTTLSSFDEPLTVTMSYEAADVTGFDLTTLKIYRYNGTTWNELSGCTIDTDARTVSCTTTQFSDFALFGTPTEEEEEEEAGGGSARTYSSSPKATPAAETAEITRLRALIAELTAKLKALGGMTPTVSTTTLPARDLEMGMEGEEVRALQIYLNTHGFLLAATGPGSRGYETTRFGALTYQALKRFQAAHSVPSTGYYGPLTRKAMAE